MKVTAHSTVNQIIHHTETVQSLTDRVRTCSNVSELEAKLQRIRSNLTDSSDICLAPHKSTHESFWNNSRKTTQFLGLHLKTIHICNYLSKLPMDSAWSTLKKVRLKETNLENLELPIDLTWQVFCREIHSDLLWWNSSSSAGWSALMCCYKETTSSETKNTVMSKIKCVKLLYIVYV